MANFVTSGTYDSGTSSLASHSFTVDCSSGGSNRVLIVKCYNRAPGTEITSATADTNNMTAQVTSENTNVCATRIYTYVNPDDSVNVVIGTSAFKLMACTWELWDGVDQTTPVSATSTGGTFGSSFSVQTDLIYHKGGITGAVNTQNARTITATAGTESQDFDPGSTNLGQAWAAYKELIGIGDGLLSGTLSSADNWRFAGVALKPSTVTLVQVQTAQALTNSNVTSQAATFASNTTTGNMIIVATGTVTGASNSVSSVTDSQGNTYSLAKREADGTGAFIEIWYAMNITGGTTPTVTVNYSGSVRPGVNITEYSGLATSSALDVTYGNSNQTLPTITIGATTATVDADELVFTASTANHTTANASASNGSGLMQQQTASTVGLVLKMVRGATTAAAQTTTYTTASGTSATVASAIATFKLASTSTTLTMPLLTNSNTLYGHTVTPQAVTATLPLLTNSSTLYAHTVTPVTSLALPLLTNTETLYAPTVTTGAVTTTLPLLTNTSTLYAPTASPQSVTATLPLLTNSQTLYAPTLQQNVTLPLLTNSSTLYSHTVTPQAITVTLPLLTNTNTLYAPTLTGSNGLELPLLTNTSTPYSPTISVAAVTITLPLLTSTNALYTHTISVGGVATVLPFLASVATLFSPSVAQANNDLTLPLLTSELVLYPPFKAYRQELVYTGVSWVIE